MNAKHRHPGAVNTLGDAAQLARYGLEFIERHQGQEHVIVGAMWAICAEIAARDGKPVQRSPWHHTINQVINNDH